MRVIVGSVLFTAASCREEFKPPTPSSAFISLFHTCSSFMVDSCPPLPLIELKAKQIQTPCCCCSVSQSLLSLNLSHSLHQWTTFHRLLLWIHSTQAAWNWGFFPFLFLPLHHDKPSSLRGKRPKSTGRPYSALPRALAPAVSVSAQMRRRRGRGRESSYVNGATLHH